MAEPSSGKRQKNSLILPNAFVTSATFRAAPYGYPDDVEESPHVDPSDSIQDESSDESGSMSINRSNTPPTSEEHNSPTSQASQASQHAEAFDKALNEKAKAALLNLRFTAPSNSSKDTFGEALEEIVRTGVMPTKKDVKQWIENNKIPAPPVIASFFSAEPHLEDQTSFPSHTPKGI